jgi:hypothetical protein
MGVVRVIIVRVMMLPVSSVRRAGLSQIDSLARQEECRLFSRQPLASSVSGTWVPYELFPLYIWAW